MVQLGLAKPPRLPQKACSSGRRSERWLGLGGRGGGVLERRLSSFMPKARGPGCVSTFMVGLKDVSSKDRWSGWGLQLSLLQKRAAGVLLGGPSRAPFPGRKGWPKLLEGSGGRHSTKTSSHEVCSKELDQLSHLVGTLGKRSRKR